MNRFDERDPNRGAFRARRGWLAGLAVLGPALAPAHQESPGPIDTTVEHLFELLLPPRLGFQISVGISTQHGLFGAVAFGPHKYRTDFDESDDEGVARLRREVHEHPESPAAHLDYAEALKARARTVRDSAERTLYPDDTLQASHTLDAEALHHFLICEEALRERFASGQRGEDDRLTYVSCLLGLGRRAEAMVILQELVDGDPPSWRAMARLAALETPNPFLERSELDTGVAVETKRGQTEAFELLDRALELNPRAPELHSARITALIVFLLDSFSSNRGLDPELSSQLERRILEYRAAVEGDQAATIDAAGFDAAFIFFRALLRAVGSGFSMEDLLEDAGGWQPALQRMLAEIPRHVDEAELSRCLQTLQGIDQLEGDARKSTSTLVAEFFTGLCLGDAEGLLREGELLLGRLTRADLFTDLVQLTPALLSMQGKAPDEATLLELVRSASSAEIPMVAGEVLCRKGRFAEGERLFRLALSRTPNHPRAWVDLGVALARQQGVDGEARAAFERVLSMRLADPTYRALAGFGRGLLAWRSGDIEGARTSLAGSVRTSPGGPDALRAYAEVLRRSAAMTGSTPEEPVHLFVRAAELYRQESARRASLPHMEWLEGEAEPLVEARACIDAANEALHESRDRSEATGLRLRIEILEGEIRLAQASTDEIRRTLVETLFELDRGVGLQEEELRVLGEHLLELARKGDKSAASDALRVAERAVEESHGRDPRCHETLAVALQQLGRPGEALEALLQAVHVGRSLWGGDVLHRDLDRIERRLGGLLGPLVEQVTEPSKRDRYRGLLHDLILARAERAAATRDDLMNAAVFLSDERAGVFYDPEGALAYVRKAAGLSLLLMEEARLGSPAAQVQVELGRAFHAAHLPDKASTAFRKALELDPENSEAHREIGALLEEQGRLAEAIQELQEAVRLNPRSAVSFLKLGEARVRTKAHVEGIEALREAVRLEPKNATNHLTLGWALASKGDHAAAAEVFAKGVELAPGSAYGWRELGRARVHSGAPAEGLEALRRAVRLDPRNALNQTSLGWALIEQGESREALAAARRALEANPKDEQAYLLLVSASFHSGDPGAAIQAARAGLLQHPESPHLNNCLAWHLATAPDPGLRDPAAAVVAARVAVDLDGKNGSHWGTLGTALYRHGEFEQALDALGRAIQLKRGHDPRNGFFMAMTNQRMGRSRDAREWYERSLEWMAADGADDEELLRFKAEASELIGQ